MSNVKNHIFFSVPLLIILLTAFYLILISIDTTYIGISVKKNSTGEWEVSYVTKENWATEQGITVGDIITSVNGNNPDEHPSIKKYNIIENIEILEILRNGEVFSYVVNETNKNLFFHYTILPSISFIIFLAFSLFLYIKKREDAAAIILIFFLLAVGFSYLSAGGSSRGVSIARFINGMTFLLIPVLFIHFLYRYYRRFHVSLCPSKILHTLYALNGLLIVINGAFTLGNFGDLFPIIRTSQLALFSISMFVCFLVILLGYIRYKETTHEPIFKLMIIGITLSFFPFIGLMVIPKILFDVPLISGEVVAIFLLFFPFFLIYLVTANRLLDIDFVIHRLRYYALLSILPTILMLLFLYFNYIDHTGIGWIQSFSIIFLGLIAVF